MIRDNMGAILLISIYFIASMWRFFNTLSYKKDGGYMSDALLDAKTVNGIAVKCSFSSESSWWICAGGNNSTVSFKMHQGDYKNGKNGCDIEDVLTAVCMMLTRQSVDRKCFNDPLIQEAIGSIENARKKLMIHNCECLSCSPGIAHVR